MRTAILARYSACLCQIGCGGVALFLAACTVDSRAPGVNRDLPAPPFLPASGAGGVSNSVSTTSGGSAGENAVGAQGGSGATAAEAGSGGGSDEPVVEGVAENALEITEGAVLPGSNPFLIYGELSVGVSGDNTPAAVSFEPYGVCASGMVAQAPRGFTPDMLNRWALRVGLSLAQSEGAVLGNSWDRDGGRVDGFAFELEGPAIPSGLRFVMHTAGPTNELFCKVLGEVQSGQRVEVSFNEMTVTCWELGGVRAQGDLFLYNVSWEVPSSYDGPVPYDFCLREIAPVFLN